MTNPTLTAIEILRMIVLAILFIGFPVYAAIIAFHKGRNGWGKASLISIPFLAGWLVGLIALFVKPGFLPKKDNASIKRNQSIAFSLFFLAPISFIIISLLMISSQENATAKVVTPTVTQKPTVERVAIHPQDDCDEITMATPTEGEDIANLFHYCSCLSGSEVTVNGRYCIPSTVSSADSYYIGSLKSTKTECRDGNAGANAPIPVGDSNNEVNKVTGMYTSLMYKDDLGKAFGISEDGRILTLRATIDFDKWVGRCSLGNIRFVEVFE